MPGCRRAGRAGHDHKDQGNRNVMGAPRLRGGGSGRGEIESDGDGSRFLGHDDDMWRVEDLEEE